ncbi:hypothetical protein C7456_1089 [Fulvimonas soli]|uniref:Uncharacterized protein n=1 Tax=Fulvimonas soli TaxID=155197 RepID=A0A316IEM8_9GAMM|nr:hypothetical protein C7456_1089 [Fulvimonas soli]
MTAGAGGCVAAGSEAGGGTGAGGTSGVVRRLASMVFMLSITARVTTLACWSDSMM